MTATEAQREKLIHRYTYGMCDALALALHAALAGATGLGMLVNLIEDEYGDTNAIPIHAFTRMGDLAVDCNGFQSMEELIDRFPVLEGKVVAERCSEDELRFMFTMEGVTDEQISQALADAQTLGLLTSPAPGGLRRGPAAQM